MKDRAVIVSGGEIRDYSFYKDYIKENDYIICADGGSIHINNLNIDVDLFLGDFDSCDFDLTKKGKHFISSEILRFKKEKDSTDTHIAVCEAIERGYKRISIIAALGGRMDHMMANIYLLKLMEDKGVDGEIIDEKNIVKYFSKSFAVSKKEGYYISFLPLSGSVTGLTLSGLKYSLCDYTLKSGDSICISNEFSDKEARIDFDSGEILMFLSKD
ncbi:MAG: thiamine diphosphokinase [Ruminococcaceae bacterium]|nr:thiamine diphosphokinase [Oscillospiraceae bacterium]